MNKKDLRRGKMAEAPLHFSGEGPAAQIQSGYCACGCGALLKNPSRFMRGHSLRCKKPRYRIDGETGCWNWSGHIRHDGYPGFIRWKGIQKMAHVIFYIRYKGPIPDGLEIDHLCNNVRCVNPEHLEAKTHRANSRRGRNLKLSVAKAEIIRKLSADGMTKTEIAKQFGVCRSAVSQTVSGLRWGPG